MIALHHLGKLITLYRKRLRSKAESLIALLSYSSNPLQIIPVLLLYTTRYGAMDVSLSKIGVQKKIRISSNNVDYFIGLIKAIHKLRPYVKVLGDTIVVNKDDLRIKIDLNNISSENLRYFMEFLMTYSVLLRHAKIIKSLRDELMYIELEDGTKWVVRKGVLSDLALGVILPEHEWYEYNLWFSKFIKKVKTFIDVGAYIGGYSVRACKEEVYTISIEPDPDNFTLLSTNIVLNDCESMVKLLNVAASDRNETITLYTVQDPKNINVVGKGIPKTKVKAVPLDEVLSDKDLERPLMIKIDVEGFEHRVVKGLRKILQNARYVMVEIHPENRDEVLKFMRSLGFKTKDRFLVSKNKRRF